MLMSSKKGPSKQLLEIITVVVNDSVRLAPSSWQLDRQMSLALVNGDDDENEEEEEEEKDDDDEGDGEESAIKTTVPAASTLSCSWWWWRCGGVEHWVEAIMSASASAAAASSSWSATINKTGRRSLPDRRSPSLTLLWIK